MIPTLQTFRVGPDKKTEEEEEDYDNLTLLSNPSDNGK